MEPFEQLISRVVVLPVENVDTDQVIPARFLKVTDKSGLGDALFADWRYDAKGEPRPDFVLNHPSARGACILLAGNNFGCGSSREHAAWALAGFGFRAVVSTHFADIFRSNALKNGLLPVTIPTDAHIHLLATVGAEPATEVTIDLRAGELRFAGETVPFLIEPFARHCLLNGVDQLGFLLGADAEISRYEAEHPGFVTTTEASGEGAWTH